MVRLNLIKLVTIVGNSLLLIFVVKWIISNAIFVAEYFAVSPSEIIAKDMRSYIDTLWAVPGFSYSTLNFSPPEGWYRIEIKNKTLCLDASLKGYYIPTYYCSKIQPRALNWFVLGTHIEKNFLIFNISQEEDGIKVERV